MRASWTPFPSLFTSPRPCAIAPLHTASFKQYPGATDATQHSRLPKSISPRCVLRGACFVPLVLFQSRLLCPEMHLPYPSTVISGANLPASNSRQGFGRGGNNKNQPPKSPAQTPQAPQPAAIPNSQSLTNSLTMDNLAANDPDAPKYFFQEKYAPLNVRGNFLTLCACPKNVELGEWLAHQSKLSRG